MGGVEMTYIVLGFTVLGIALVLMLVRQTLRIISLNEALVEAKAEKQRMYGRELAYVQDQQELRVLLKDVEHELDQAKTENVRAYGREMSLLEVRFTLARVQHLADLAYRVGITQELNWLMKDNERNPVKELTDA